MKKLLLVSLLCCAFAGFVQAQDISGPQSGILGPGTYTVVGDVSVRSGYSLEIMPGTEFLHDGHHTWSIEGILTAQGTESDSIKFLREQPLENNKWGGIRFGASASSECILDYCVIDYCLNTGLGTSGGGIYTVVDLIVTNSRISRQQVWLKNGQSTWG